MSNTNLYASRDGALYQSYDNYAGAQGFFDPVAGQQQHQKQQQLQPKDDFASQGLSNQNEQQMVRSSVWSGDRLRFPQMFREYQPSPQQYQQQTFAQVNLVVARLWN